MGETGRERGRERAKYGRERRLRNGEMQFLEGDRMRKRWSFVFLKSSVFRLDQKSWVRMGEKYTSP